MCSQFWDSLSKGQQDVVKLPESAEIRCEIAFPYHHEEEDNPIALSIAFQGGNELWECEDSNDVGGWTPFSYGHFVLLSTKSMPFSSHSKFDG